MAEEELNQLLARNKHLNFSLELEEQLKIGVKRKRDENQLAEFLGE